MMEVGFSRLVRFGLQGIILIPFRMGLLCRYIDKVDVRLGETIMADILFKCPSCTKSLAVDAEHVGKKVACTDCKAPVTIPQPDFGFACPHCRHEMLTLEKYEGEKVTCSACGKEVIIPEDENSVQDTQNRPKDATLNYCAECGAKIYSAEAQFCTKCGARLDGLKRSENPQANQEYQYNTVDTSPVSGKTERSGEVKSTIWAWTALGVFVCGFLGGQVGVAIGLFLGSNSFSIVGLIIGAITGGLLTFRSSRRSGGECPPWLWKSKKKAEDSTSECPAYSTDAENATYKIARGFEDRTLARHANVHRSSTELAATSFVGDFKDVVLIAVFCVSVLAFFLPNLIITIPALGTVKISMYEMLSPLFANLRHLKVDSGQLSQQPETQALVQGAKEYVHSELPKLTKLNFGIMLCCMALLGILLHYVLTIVWFSCRFIFQSSFERVNGLWLISAIQFPIFLTIGFKIIMDWIKHETGKASGDPLAIMFSAAIDSFSVDAGSAMWVLMALSTFGLLIVWMMKNQESNIIRRDVGLYLLIGLWLVVWFVIKPIHPIALEEVKAPKNMPQITKSPPAANKPTSDDLHPSTINTSQQEEDANESRGSSSTESEPSPSVNLLKNGNFEEQWSGWNHSGNITIEKVWHGTDGPSIAIFNSNDLPPNAVLSQAVPTIIGESYRLQFDFGAYKGGRAAEQSLAVIIKGKSVLLNRQVKVPAFNPLRYSSFSLAFVADGATTTIQFTDCSQQTRGVDGVLDNVRVIPKSPSQTATSSGKQSDDEKFYVYVIEQAAKVKTVSEQRPLIQSYISRYPNGEYIEEMRAIMEKIDNKIAVLENHRKAQNQSETPSSQTNKQVLCEQQYNKMKEESLRSFESPVGKVIKIPLSSGTTLEGIVQNITEDEITIAKTNSTVSITVNKKQISSKQRLNLFASEYAENHVAEVRKNNESEATAAVNSAMESASAARYYEDAINILEKAIDNNIEARNESDARRLLASLRNEAEEWKINTAIGLVKSNGKWMTKEQAEQAQLEANRAEAYRRVQAAEQEQRQRQSERSRSYGGGGAGHYPSYEIAANHAAALNQNARGSIEAIREQVTDGSYSSSSPFMEHNVFRCSEHEHCWVVRSQVGRY